MKQHSDIETNTGSSMSDAADNSEPAKKRAREIYKVTAVGSCVNLLLVLFKFFAGVLGHSSAMIADAVHSLSDFITDVIVIVFVRVSSRPADKNHDYGHGKYETLATAVIGLMLFGVGAGICWHGAKDIWSFFHGGELPEPGMIALMAALASIALKEALFHYTIRRGRRIASPAVIANAWHHRSDALSSISTAVGIAGAIFLGGRWRVLDPLAAVLVSLFIMRVAVKLLLPCIDELLEKSLPEDEEREIVEIIESVDGVRNPHKLRTRRIGSYRSIDAHICMDGNLSLRSAHVAATEVEKRLRDKLGSQTIVNIHVEPV